MGDLRRPEEARGGPRRLGGGLEEAWRRLGGDLITIYCMCLSTYVLLMIGFEIFVFVKFGKVPFRFVHVPNWFAVILLFDFRIFSG